MAVATLKSPRKTSKRKQAAAKPLPLNQQPGFIWLQLPELAEAYDQAIAEVPGFDNSDPAQLRTVTRQWLRQELDFMNNPEFKTAGAEAIFEAPLNLRRGEKASFTRRGKLADLPVHLGRMCEAELLTPEQERLLFQRMNYLRYQAVQIRSQLNADEPDTNALRMLQLLLGMADWHRDAIVQANLRLVFSIVKKFVNKSNAFDDLLSDGIVALIRAVEKFDYDRGFRFSTYATQVVRRNAYRTVVQKQKEKSKVAGGLQDLGLDVSDETRQPAISEHRWHELRSRLAIMLGDLDRREKFIIRARFSLGSHRKVHTLQALADRLGVSKERVRQLEKRALEKLRSMAGEIKLAELES